MKSIRVKIGLLLLVLAVLSAAFLLVPRKRPFNHYVSRAQEAFQNKTFNRSIELYLKALKYYPNHERTPEILLTVGDIYNFSLGNTEKAAKAYETLEEKYPRTLEARRGFQNAGEMHEKNEQFEKALLSYQGMIDHFPDGHGIDEIRFKVATMALKLKKYEPARRSLMAIVENNPETPIADKVLYQLGNIFFVEGSSREAAQVLEVAVEKYPNSPLNTEMRFTLANAYEEQGKLAEALRIYKKIQGLYPNPMVIEKKIENLSKKVSKETELKDKIEKAKKTGKALTEGRKAPEVKSEPELQKELEPELEPEAPVEKPREGGSLNNADGALFP